MQRHSIWILCYGKVQEYPSVQRRTGMPDMRNVNFCNRSLVFNHCHSWGIQLPSFLSFKSFIMGKFTHYSLFNSSFAAAIKHHIHAEGASETVFTRQICIPSYTDT